PRDSMEFYNGTSFHLIGASPVDALTQATAAAHGLNVRIGGGPSTVRQFLAAGLVDFLHIVIVPVVVGRGVAPREGRDGVEQDFAVESVTTASGVTHQLWNRRG